MSFVAFTSEIQLNIILPYRAAIVYGTREKKGEKKVSDNNTHAGEAKRK